MTIETNSVTGIYDISDYSSLSGDLLYAPVTVNNNGVSVKSNISTFTTPETKSPLEGKIYGGVVDSTIQFTGDFRDIVEISKLIGNAAVISSGDYTRTVYSSLTETKKPDIRRTILQSTTDGSVNNGYAFDNCRLSSVGLSGVINNPIKESLNYIGGKITPITTYPTLNYYAPSGPTHFDFSSVKLEYDIGSLVTIPITMFQLTMALSGLSPIRTDENNGFSDRYIKDWRNGVLVTQFGFSWQRDPTMPTIKDLLKNMLTSDDDYRFILTLDNGTNKVKFQFTDAKPSGSNYKSIPIVGTSETIETLNFLVSTIGIQSNETIDIARYA